MSRARLGITLSVALIASLAGWRSNTPTQPPASALASTDSAILKSLHWRNLGPDRGGRSIAISGVKGQPKVGYFGATGGGLWKTTDGGEHWANITDGQIHSSSVGAVAVSETDPNIIYMGMGEAEIRGDIQPGDGLYKSTDAGKTWTHIGFENSDAISHIRIHPTNPNIVFVSDFGKFGANSEERGIFKSTDGGKSWRKVLYKSPNAGGVDVEIDRTNPNVMYAALWEAFRKEWEMSSGGPNSGMYKSTDGGETWTEITHAQGLPAGIDGKIGISVSSADPNRVFAMVENENGGLFRSDDAGATWTLVNNERRFRQRAFYYTHVFADTKNKDLVYVENVGTFRSTDGGKTFDQRQFARGDSHDIWIDPDDNNHVLHAADPGGDITFNALAETPVWSSVNYPKAQIYHIVATAHIPFYVCGSQQDESETCMSSAQPAGGGRGFGGGRGNQQVNEFSPGGSEDGYIAPDPHDPDIFYSGTNANGGGFLTKLNRRTGEVTEVSPYPRMFSGEESALLKERWQWTYPIVFSPVDGKTLYAGSQHLWKTTNGGLNWTRISPDLTRHDPKTMGPSGGPITRDMNGPEVYAVIFSIAPSKRTTNVIWTGSDDGLIHVTKDGGTTWANVTPKDMPDFGRVSLIDAGAHDSATAYVAVKRFLLDDKAPYIYRTHDMGKTWTKIVNGIAPDDFVHAVREDPTRTGLLYAGTEHGVYTSYDDGDHWQSLSLNLPDIPVWDLIVVEDNLAIATHGRSFYILDHIEPLRQYSEKLMAGTNPILFRPAPAIRGANQPATIQYLLRQPAQNVRDRSARFKGTGRALVSRHRERGERRGRRARRWRRPWPRWIRRQRGARKGCGDEHFRVGYALRAAGELPGNDSLGRLDHRARSGARQVHGAPHGGRTHGEPAARRETPPAARSLRRRPRGADGARPRHPRQGQRGKHGGDPDSRLEEAGRRPSRKIERRQSQVARRLAHGEAQQSGRGDLSGAQPERTGSAQLPDQAEQPPRVAHGRRHARRFAADRKCRADLQ